MKKYFLLIILLFIASINFNLILRPLNLVTGGTQGLAILGKHILSINPSLIVFIVNTIMLLLSFIFLKKETTLGTIIATFTYPLFIRLTDFINPLNISILISALIAGIVCGITCGLIYKLGFSTGGITVISVILKKYFDLKISITNFIINSSILIISCFYFGFIKLIYSLIVIIINSTLIYLIMKKIEAKSLFS